jgi:hypothetical protein
VQEATEAHTLLISSKKLADLGEMSAGIAHEINNPLAIIQGRAEQIKHSLTHDKFSKEFGMLNVNKIIATTERISKIVKSLRTVSRDSSNDPYELTPLSKMVEETLDLCQEKFKKQYGGALPSKMNDDARAFRLDTMRDFLEEVMAFTKSKNMRNALCLYAFKGHAEFDRIWQKAAALKDLDIFGCDPYWRWRTNKDPKAHVADFSKHVVDQAKINNKKSQIWIQAMRLSAGTEEEIDAAVKAAVDEKVDYIAAWSFDGGELLDTVLSENPVKVREVLERAFKRYRV